LGGPDVVEVHPRGHDADDDFEGPGLGDLDLLELERVHGIALPLLTDDPGGHRLGQLARLGVDGCNSLKIHGHRARILSVPYVLRPRRRNQTCSAMIETTSAPTPSSQKAQGPRMRLTIHGKFCPKKPVMKVSGRKIVPRTVRRVTNW